MGRPRSSTKSVKLNSIVKHLIKIREARGWTQKEMAEELDYDQSKIARMEVGALKPSVLLVRRIMKAFGMTADQLFASPAGITDEERDEQEMLARYRKLSPEQQETVRRVADNYTGDRQFIVVLATSIEAMAIHRPKIIDKSKSSRPQEED